METIESLDKRLSKLEKSSINLFNRTYQQVGSLDSDLVLRTKGQVKINFGTKFIDLVKDGKINVDASFIYETDSVGNKDGIYVIGNSAYLKIGDTVLTLVEEGIGTTYVAFLEAQDTTSEMKSTALENIGFFYGSLSDLDDSSLQNGIVYIESEQKLYIVQDGVATEFTCKFPNPITEQVVISKSDGTTGSLYITGSGISNSLAFDSFYIYVQDGQTYLQSVGDLSILVDDETVVTFDDLKTIFYSYLCSDMITSINATANSGFRLYVRDGISYLEVDRLIVRDPEEEEEDVAINVTPDMVWYYNLNEVVSMENPYTEDDDLEDDTENSDTEKLDEFSLTLAYAADYEVGDTIFIYVPITTQVEGGTDEDGNVWYTDTYTQVLLPLIVTDVDGTDITVKVDTSVATQSFTYADLHPAILGQTVYLVAKTAGITALRLHQNNMDLVTATNGTEALGDPVGRFGDIGELGLQIDENNKQVSMSGNGVYAQLGLFDQAAYTTGNSPSDDDDSSRFATTHWTRDYVQEEIAELKEEIEDEIAADIKDVTSDVSDLTTRLTNDETIISSNTTRITNLENNQPDLTDIYSQLETLTNGSSTHPIILVSGVLRRNSTSSTVYSFTGDTHSGITDLTGTVSGGIMTITIYHSSSYTLKISSVQATQCQSGDTADGSSVATISGKNTGAHWYEAFTESADNVVYIREFHKDDDSNSSWKSSSWTDSSATTAVNVTIFGYMA